MHQADVIVLYNQEVAHSCYKMRFLSSEIAESAKPGQFIMIKAGGEFGPLLRRPLSIHRILASEGAVEILYKVVGTGTRLLSETKKGDFLNLLGPLGNGFKINTDLHAAVIVSGGIGVAPLLFLAEKISEKKIDLLILLGAKTKNDILAVSELENLGGEIKLATEDGSLGCRGLVSELLEKRLGPPGSPVSKIHCFTCGPRRMMARVAKLSKQYKIPCQVSLEAGMACGIGACLGCAVETKPREWENYFASQPHYQRVCKDGPVFDSDEVVW